MTEETMNMHQAGKTAQLFDPTRVSIIKASEHSVETVELITGQVWDVGGDDDFQPVRIAGFGLSFGETWVEYDWYEEGSRHTDTCNMNNWLDDCCKLVAQSCDLEAWEKGEFKPLDNTKPDALNNLSFSTAFSKAKLLFGARINADSNDDAKSKRPKIKANEICQQAIDTMIERGKTYDKDATEVKDCPKKERSMGKTVTAFNALTGQNLTETQGWLFMAVLKMARSQQGEYKHDNYLDGTAYFALAGEAASMSQ